MNFIKHDKMFFSLCLFILCVLSLSVYIDSMQYWTINIVSHFPAQYALLSLVLIVRAVYRKLTGAAVLAGILFILNAGAIVENSNTAFAGGEKQNTFKLYSANIYKYNRDLSKLKQELHKINADIVLLIEVTPKQIKQLNSLIDTFPYHTKNIPLGTENIGMVFLSRFPMISHEVIKLSEHGNGIIKSELIINQKSVLFYGVHLPKTISIKEFPERKRQIMWFAHQINKNSTPVIVAGDMNATPYSPIFKNFIKISGLKDTRKGFGWQPSWPSYFPPLWIPIDHILVSPEVEVYRRDTGSYIGSDHFPVIAELSIS